MNFYFVIFAGNDVPIYEIESMKSDSFKGEDMADDLHKFIIFAALDMVDGLRWSKGSGDSPYLRIVDRYNEWLVSAYLCPSGDRLMLLHDVKSDDAVRQFFTEVNEAYTKLSLNIFHQRESKIGNLAFDKRARQIATKYLQ